MRGARCGRKRRRILLKVAAPEETYNPCRPLSEAKEAGRDVVRAYLLYTLYYLISFGVLRDTPQFGIYCYYEGKGSLLNLGISGSNVTVWQISPSVTCTCNTRTFSTSSQVSNKS